MTFKDKLQQVFPVGSEVDFDIRNSVYILRPGITGSPQGIIKEIGEDYVCIRVALSAGALASLSIPLSRIMIQQYT